jgi:uncharacterized SAM-binding protein YcdF (DUF218 family)
VTTGHESASAAGEPRRRGISRTLLWTFAIYLGCTGLYLGGIVLSDPLLTIRSKPERSDVIVVLGGDGPARAVRASALYEAGLAPRVLVTGDGDCTFIAERMIKEGVAPASIELECASGTTEENAFFSAPLLGAAKIRTAIIVTSWFHSRRAIETFVAVMPSIEWRSVPTEPPSSTWQIATTRQGLQIAKEYPKTVIYAWRRFVSGRQDFGTSGDARLGSAR